MLGLLSLVLAQNPDPIEIAGDRLAARVEWHAGEWRESLRVKDDSGKWREVLVTPTDPRVAPSAGPKDPAALKRLAPGLYEQAPTWSFQKAALEGSEIVLSRDVDGVRVEKRLSVHEATGTLHVKMRVEFAHPTSVVHLLDAYAFAPDGKPMRTTGKPDATHAPAFRPGDDQVIGEHFFRAPFAMVRKGALSATIVPDLDVLADHRALPAVMDLDATSGVADAPLLAYGFADHRVSGHVYLHHDSGMAKEVSESVEWAMDVLLDARATTGKAMDAVNRHLWTRYGAGNFDKVLPQAMPFEEYARVCYPAALDEHYGDNKLGWFEHEIDGNVCGGIPAGWGFTNGWVSWQCWFNNLRSAWGMRWWGRKLGEADWVDKADKMLNLALAAPMDQGAVPTTYLSREKQWKGTLIAPSPDCYYDLTNMAWKGLWMLRWLEFGDCPRREEVLRQCLAMADCMVRHQNADGSVPTWLSQDLQVVPILDHSAQTALPGWFLAELAHRPDGKRFLEPALKAARFVADSVVPGFYYYDFETFFSCSPKKCFQANGTTDHEAMRDPHTLQPPQNTLCMQWAAEALESAATLSPGEAGTFREASMLALDTMITYQNVWSLPFRPTAYTYGGFGVQNSDGEYLDARQAQFGATLADFGARLGRRDLFQRGVAATRASMALINHPLHAKYGIYPNPNYPLGLQPENCGHGGTDQQNGRTGFDWGEGSGLASMAWLLHRYGQGYVDDAGQWSVGIDGVFATQEGGFARRLLSDLDQPLPSRTIEVRHSRGQTAAVPVRHAPALLSMTFGAFEGGVAASAILTGDDVAEVRGQLVRDDGATTRLAGAALAEQSGAIPRWRLWVKLPPEWHGRRFRLEASVRGLPVAAGPFRIDLNPVYDYSSVEGWKVTGNFAEFPMRPLRGNYGTGSAPLIGTCENGRGGYDDTYTGTIVSPSFLVTKSSIRLLVGGGSGEGVRVELVRESSGEVLYTERGHDRERMDERIWDVSKLQGETLFVRIVDMETLGWGHINVGTIRIMD